MISVCRECNGFAYRSGMWSVPLLGPAFPVLAGTGGACASCRGSGLEGMTAREGYLAEFPRPVFGKTMAPYVEPSLLDEEGARAESVAHG